jgi:hypothetical protein
MTARRRRMPLFTCCHHFFMPIPPKKVRYILPHENQMKSDSDVIRKYDENVNSSRRFSGKALSRNR